MLRLESIVKEEMMTVEDIQHELEAMDCNSNSMEGIEFVLNHDPYLRGIIQRNDMTGQTDILGPVPWKRRGVHMTDTDMYNLALYMEKNYKLSDQKLEKVVDVVANEHSFHPIKDYLEALEWDGEERIAKALHHFMGAEQNEYTAAVMKMHMLAAISRIYKPGCKYDIMLCLVGGQGTGKSTFFKYLATNDEWFTDDMKTLEDKSVFEYLQCHWIIELGEMHAVTNGKSIEGTKAFITRQKDVYRIPYQKRAEDRERQCVFCGTSNDMTFLPYDRTGNRRFAPVSTNVDLAEVKICDDEKHARHYFEQMWAEAMEIYRNGDFRLTFSEDMEAYVKTLQTQFTPEDTKVGMIQQFLDDYEDDYVCTAIIHQKALGDTGIPQRWQSKEYAEIMDNSIEGWVKHGSNHRFGGGIGTQRAWRREKPKKDEEGFLQVPEQMEIPFKKKFFILFTGFGSQKEGKE